MRFGCAAGYNGCVMTKWTRATLIGLIVAAALALGWWTLPRAVEALPGEIRARLPEEFLRAVTTPLPTALPAPQMVATAVSPLQLGVPDVASTETPTATPTPAAAVRPTGTAVIQPTPSPSATAPPTATPLPRRVRLDGLTITPQKLNNCGPTNLSISLQFYGLPTTQFDVAEVVKPNYEDRNVSPEELVDYVNAFTELEAAVYRAGDLALLKQLLAAGYPVVIEKGYEPDWQGWMGHYLTLFGYDDAAREFAAMDTFAGPWDGSGRAYSYDDIERSWSHFNYAFFVVYPPAERERIHALLPEPLRAPDMMWAYAAQRAQSTLVDAPENAFGWFNLGSSLTQLAHLRGDDALYSDAAAAFDQARLYGLPTRMLWYQFEPYAAYLANGRTEDVLTLSGTILENVGGRNVEETYLYRGQALAEIGQVGNATAVLRQALRLRPDFPEAEAALAALAGD